MTSQNPIYSFQNKLSRNVLQSIEEIISHNGLNAVLNQADLRHLISGHLSASGEQMLSFDEIRRIQVALEQLYGPRGGRGLALRSGRVFFKTVLREFGEELGFKNKDFRLLPLDKKVISGLNALATLFNEHSDQIIEVDENTERYLWKIERCPFCWNRSSDIHVCFLEVGMLQEALYWVSGGKYFFVEEIECVSKGDLSCTMAISKTSLD